MGLAGRLLEKKLKQDTPKLMEQHKKDPSGLYWTTLDKMLNLHESMGKVTKQQVLDHVRLWSEK